MNEYAYKFLMHSLNSTDFQIGGFSILDDISILFTSSKSTPTIDSTSLDVISDHSNGLKTEKNLVRYNDNRVRRKMIPPRSSNIMPKFVSNYDQFDSNEMVDCTNQSHIETMEIMPYVDGNTNNQIGNCQCCNKHVWYENDNIRNDEPMYPCHNVGYKDNNHENVMNKSNNQFKQMYGYDNPTIQSNQINGINHSILKSHRNPHRYTSNIISDVFETDMHVIPWLGSWAFLVVRRRS